MSVSAAVVADMSGMRRGRRLALSGGPSADAVRAYEALAEAHRAVDAGTARHAAETAVLALRIGRALGVSSDTQVALYFGGLVHDVGKLWLPRSVLGKPGPLTSEETRLVREHPELGRRVLENVAAPWPVALIAHQHHERLDGSGYPGGLKGDAIAREAKIVAVADVLQAMSTKRPYRPALSCADIRVQLEAERAAGRLDPAACAAAIDMLARDEADDRCRMRSRAPMHDGTPDAE